MRDVETYNSLPKPDISVSMTVFCMSVLVLIALWIRVSGLAYPQLAQDEYYFISSVQNIMEFYVPRFSSGGYYIRGILLQYLTAISIFLFGNGGFAYRLPSAIFGTGTIVMAYFLGRRFLDRSWSVVCAALLAFSSWEIEFSRFARMYSAFQFVSVCFFWSLYQYSFNAKSTKKYLAVFFAIIAILTHQLGIFLALLLFLPVASWLDGNWRKTISEQRFYITLSSIVLFLGYFQTKYNFRLIGVSNSLPPDFILQGGHASQLFLFGKSLFGSTGFILFGVLTSLCISGWYVLYILREDQSADAEEQILGGLMVLAACSAAFHQLSICTLIMLIVVLRQPKFIFKRPYLYLLALLAMLVGMWLGLLWFSHTKWSYLTSIRLNFFVFPDLHKPIFRAWATSTPLLGFFLLLAGGWQVLCSRRLPLGSMLRNPIVSILLIVVLMGIRPPLFVETRYSHFLYPLMLCVGLMSGSQIGEIVTRRLIGNKSLKKIASIALCLVAFSVSEDFHLFHLLHLNSDIIVFRTGKYDRFSSHWYQRWDFKGVAELLNADKAKASKIFVSREVDTLGFYLDKEYVLYWPRDANDYTIVSRYGGTRALWSGKPMISNNEQVIDLTEDTERVWLVFYPEWKWWQLDPETVWPGRVKNVEVFKAGRDKRIEVWKIDLRRAE